MKQEYTNHAKQIILVVAAAIFLIGALLITDPTITGFATNTNDTLSAPENVTENTTVNETESNISINESANLEPVQTEILPNITNSQEISFNLDEYFKDPQGQTLFYDLSNPENLDITINATTLTINPTKSGTFQIYASNGDTTITSNEISIMLETQNETNITLNETINNTIDLNETTNITINETETNTTINDTNTTVDDTNTTNNTSEEETQTEPTQPTTEEPTQTTNETTEINTTTQPTTENQTTNETTNTSTETQTTEPVDPCANENPNLVPFECIAQDPQQYIDSSSINVEDNNNNVVARLNQVGNLILEGALIENSNQQPEQEDFVVVHVGDFFEETPVAFIDSDTGDMHITGELFEEDFFLQPTSGAYVFQNVRNVNLAYIDVNTGDLHLKSNIIERRTNVGN